MTSAGSSRAVVGLGSNLGDREGFLSRALAALGELGQIASVSDVFETEPVGGPPQGPYLNAAVALDTTLGPELLLDALLAIEDRLGRVRRERWGPRVIDLDLLLYGDLRIQTPRLTVPHPRLEERPFARFVAAQVGAPIDPGPPPGHGRRFPSRTTSDLAAWPSPAWGRARKGA